MPRRNRPAPSSRRRVFNGFFQLIELILFGGLIYLVLSQSVLQPFHVEQHSMVPNVPPGTYVLIDKMTPTWDGHEYARGDIVVLTPPNGGVTPFIKRIIGLPGETLSIVEGRVWVSRDGGPARLLEEPYLNAGPDVATGAQSCSARIACDANYEVPAGHYFVVGDNRAASSDSRDFGPVPASSLIGRAWLRYFPIPSVGIFERPVYAP